MDHPHPGVPPTLEEGDVAQAPLRNQRFLLTLVVLLGIGAVFVAWPLLTAIIFAGVLGFILHPVYERFLALFRKAWLASGFMLLVVAFAMAAPLAWLVYALAQQAAQIRANLGSADGYRQQAVDLLASFGVPRASADQAITRAIDAAAGFLQGAATDLLRMLPFLVIGFVVFFILLYFVFAHGRAWVAWFKTYAPLSPARRDQLLEQTGRRVKAIFLGAFFISALQGVVAGIGWWLLGFPAPVFWGFVMTIMSILPFMGAQMITIPAGILALVRGDTFAGAGLIVYTLVVVSLIDDVVRPWVIGKHAGVHPALILIGTIGGIQVFGIAGVVLGPLILGLLAPVIDTWARAAGPPSPPQPVHPAMPGDGHEPGPPARSRVGRAS